VAPAGQGVVEVAAATVGASTNIFSRSVVTIELSLKPHVLGHVRTCAALHRDPSARHRHLLEKDMGEKPRRGKAKS
jgi:hypothetical protein